MSWQSQYIDPTAGVTLVRRVLCPRCGLDKGEQHVARPGLCRACHKSLAPAERTAWVA